jgi:agmatine/peptidylarginine deiminase
VACLAVSASVTTPAVAEQVMDEYTLFAAPTAPPEGVELVPEWEPVQAMAVALPLKGVFARQGMGGFMIDLICNAAAYTDVVVLHDEEELQTVARVIAAVCTRDEGLLKRLHFVPARVGTIWLRDHGPVFARDARGGLVLIDSVYRDARYEARVLAERDAEGADGSVYRGLAMDLAKRRKDDTSPVYLAQFLRQQDAKREVSISRPPAQVWGGDVTTDGRGNLFVSSESLTMHGGKQAELEAVLRDYYGAKTITYLEPLPGPTVKHLDMFFKVVDENTFMIASYDAPFQGAGEYARYLNGEIGRVLERNEAVLKARFPDRRFVHVPLPAVAFPTREQMIREYRDHWYTQKLLAETPSLREHLAKAIDPNERAAVEQRITERAVKQYRIAFDAEPGSEAERKLVDQLIRENSTTTLDEAIQNYAPRKVVYKTFLNSVQINGEHGQAVLVPAYSPDERMSAEAVAQMRQEVQAAYESALPGVDVVWVNCDTVIQQSGALHCVTVTVPRPIE